MGLQMARKIGSREGFLKYTVFVSNMEWGRLISARGEGWEWGYFYFESISLSVLFSYNNR